MAMKVTLIKFSRKYSQGVSPCEPERSVKGNVFDGGIDSDEGYNGDIR